MPLHRGFDYACEQAIQPGCRVRVRFAHRELVGICLEVDPADAYADAKPIEAILDATPLIDSVLLDHAHWLADYYHHPIGEVLEAMVPAEARQGASTDIERPRGWFVSDGEPPDLQRAPKQAQLLDAIRAAAPIADAEIGELGFSRAVLRALAERGAVFEADMAEPAPGIRSTRPQHTPTDDQQAAIDAVKLATFRSYLLDGITGSGKTEVYLRLIANVIEQGGQALLLVPEISLTPQTVKRVNDWFDGVAVVHSGLNDRQRWQAWLRCRSGEASVLIGTRSAVFTAFANLQLIIVDEEHDGSFKQQDGLRYSARDFAIVRAQRLDVPVILGSATPSLESLNNALQTRYTHLVMRNRPAGAQLPEFRLLDIRGHELHEGVSPQMAQVIRQHIDAGGQVLAFLNRRGFAPTQMCSQCGWTAECRDCDARMTLHTVPAHLRCHHCGARQPVPQTCPSCEQPNLLAVGLGTQRTEEGLLQLFPNVPVLRIDRDSTRSQAELNSNLDRINSGQSMILIGTQLLAKGHHFPNVTLVVVINADSGFFSPDFRAPERMAQTILQVAGRAGRAEKPGQVWIQTYQPEHPLLQQLLAEGYEAFARSELKARQVSQMPPFRPMALIRADAYEAADAQNFLTSTARTLNAHPNVAAYGPVAAPIQRISNRHRQQLMVLAPNRRALHAAILKIRDQPADRRLRWSIDIDPMDAF